MLFIEHFFILYTFIQSYRTLLYIVIILFHTIYTILNFYHLYYLQMLVCSHIPNTLPLYNILIYSYYPFSLNIYTIHIFTIYITFNWLYFHTYYKPYFHTHIQHINKKWFLFFNKCMYIFGVKLKLHIYFFFNTSLPFFLIPISSCVS